MFGDKNLVNDAVKKASDLEKTVGAAEEEKSISELLSDKVESHLSNISSILTRWDLNYMSFRGGR
jgi:hypothetical protein